MSKLRFDEIDVVKGPLELEYTWNKLALYALSVGANVKDELDYVYEKNLKIIPTYWSAISGFEDFVALHEYGGQNLTSTLCYGFETEFHKPITKIEGKIHYTVALKGIYDRGEGRGSLSYVEAVAYDENDEKVYTLITKDIDTEGGGFGGEKPPKEFVNYPDRAPDFEIFDHIGPNQAALYRIDNDKFIMHIDPEYSAICGFEIPIIAGMNTAGYGCRAVLKALCKDNPEYIKNIKMRFTNPLELDTPIVTHIWKIDEHNAVFRTINLKTQETVLNFCAVELF